MPWQSFLVSTASFSDRLVPNKHRYTHLHFIALVNHQRFKQDILHFIITAQGVETVGKIMPINMSGNESTIKFGNTYVIVSNWICLMSIVRKICKGRLYTPKANQWVMWMYHHTPQTYQAFHRVERESTWYGSCKYSWVMRFPTIQCPASIALATCVDDTNPQARDLPIRRNHHHADSLSFPILHLRTNLLMTVGSIKLAMCYLMEVHLDRISKDHWRKKHLVAKSNYHVNQGIARACEYSRA